MRAGSMGHSGFTNWVNKKREKNHNAPLKQDTQSPYKSVPTHMCKHWSSPDQGIFMRYQWMSLLEQCPQSLQSLLQALFSQLLPVTNMQAEVITWAGQRCKGWPKESVSLLVFAILILRGHLQKYVILSEAGATLHLPLSWQQTNWDTVKNSFFSYLPVLRKEQETEWAEPNQDITYFLQATIEWGASREQTPTNWFCSLYTVRNQIKVWIKAPQ